MDFAAFTLLVAWCAMLTVIDIRHRRLPDMLTGSGALIVFGYALFTTQFTTALLGAALLTIPYLLVHLVSPGAFGAGDVKLAIGLGAVAALGGARTWVSAALVAPALTAAVGVVALTVRRMRADADRTAAITVPHGPAMCLATMLALAVTYDN
ncbi:prepilin peptidase [Nocardia sp. NBC_01009]|uniref:prepilin peptidase n=1 Tax=Nocardia sp. NBC_01009 TaxID=2975996 RepID=UPI0038688C5F|nr:A24 family peptidase [Nocardia sp. NBC_01009]